MRRSRTALAVLAGACAVVAAGTTQGHAASGAAEDGTDTYNVPAKTAVTATNATPITFTAKTNAGVITVTCTRSTFGGKTGKTLKIAINPPLFDDGQGVPCNDSAGATDTVTTNATNGAWSATEKDLASDEGLPEPNASGDKMVLVIPKAGLVDVNSLGCTITAAPSGPARVTGTYDDAGTIKITNASIPASVTGCPVTLTSLKVSGTYTLNPAIFDQG